MMVPTSPKCVRGDDPTPTPRPTSPRVPEKARSLSPGSATKGLPTVAATNSAPSGAVEVPRISGERSKSFGERNGPYGERHVPSGERLMPHERNPPSDERRTPPHSPELHEPSPERGRSESRDSDTKTGRNSSKAGKEIDTKTHNGEKAHNGDKASTNPAVESASRQSTVTESPLRQRLRNAIHRAAPSMGGGLGGGGL